jgi:hypothetical protein
VGVVQTDAIDIGGVLFVLRVGTEDWVVKNQVSSSTTLFLDVVSILQVAYSNCTDQRTQLPRGLHCDVIQAAATDPIIYGAGRSVLLFWHQLRREREALGHATGIRGSEVPGEAELVVQTMSPARVTFAEALPVLAPWLVDER